MKKLMQIIRMAVLSALAILFSLPVILTFVKSFSYGERHFTLK